MTTFTIKPGSELPAAEVKKLQAVFKKMEAKAAKIAPLAKAASQYFDALASLGDDMEALSEFQEDIEANGEDFYIGENSIASAATAFDFWIPSSMSC